MMIIETNDSNVTKGTEMSLKFLIEMSTHNIFKKLQAIDLDANEITTFHKEKLKRLTYSQLTHYSNLLYISLKDFNKKKEEIVFVDYGGGIGYQSLLAKELGIGTVIYVDFDSNFTNNAKILADIVNLPANNYIVGDIDELINFINKRNIYCDILVSYDVLEHIYDIQEHFKKLPLLGQDGMRLVMGSGANEYNPILKQEIVKRQKIVEKIGRIHHPKRFPILNKKFCNISYFDARAKIILDHYPYLYTNQIFDLADKTRGLMYGDILTYVDQYLNGQKVINKNYHRTNTCDPYNGYWEEHLMNPYSLLEKLKEQGFNGVLLSGSHVIDPRGKLSGINLIFNKIIELSNFSPFFLPIAPYYLLWVEKKTM